MPLVRIDMVEGRPPERLERMIAEVSEAIARSLEAPIESVRIVINDKDFERGVDLMLPGHTPCFLSLPNVLIGQDALYSNSALAAYLP